MAEFFWGVFIGSATVAILWCLWTIVEATRRMRGYIDEYKDDQS